MIQMYGLRALLRDNLTKGGPVNLIDYTDPEAVRDALEAEGFRVAISTFDDAETSLVLSRVLEEAEYPAGSVIVLDYRKFGRVGRWSESLKRGINFRIVRLLSRRDVMVVCIGYTGPDQQINNRLVHLRDRTLVELAV